MLETMIFAMTLIMLWLALFACASLIFILVAFMSMVIGLIAD